DTHQDRSADDDRSGSIRTFRCAESPSRRACHYEWRCPKRQDRTGNVDQSNWQISPAKDAEIRVVITISDGFDQISSGRVKHPSSDSADLTVWQHCRSIDILY